MAFYTADYQVNQQLPKRHGSGVRGITPYQAYACADGSLIVAAPNDRLFARLATVLERPEWAGDARFKTSPARAENRELLNAMLTECLGAETRAHWQKCLDAAGVPCTPVQTVEQKQTEYKTDAPIDRFRFKMPTKLEVVPAKPEEQARASAPTSD